MNTFCITTTVSKDGRLSIKGLPLRLGAKVEVTERPEGRKRQASANDLKTLFEVIRTLPQAKSITEKQIASEIAAYRASKAG